MSLNREGWKWFSMYVQPDNNTPSGVFADVDGEVSLVKGVNASAVYDANLNQWSGTIKALTPSTMYKLQATKAFKQTTIGVPVDPTQVVITLNPGWNWIGYPAQASNSLTIALADSSPVDGDIIMGQSSFAIYCEGDWAGSLTGLTPGEGYKYYSSAKVAKNFRFQKPVVTRSRLAQVGDSNETPSLDLYCEDNMAIIANVTLDGEIVENAVISVYNKGVIAGFSANSDAENRHFLTIGGSRNTSFVDVIVTIDDEEFQLPNAIMFKANSLVGTMNQPFQIEIGNSASIDGICAGKDVKRIDLYSANGMLLRSIENPTALFGKEDMRNLDDGVYIMHVIFKDGTATSIVKMNR